jgi:hypothetical protein
MERCLLEPKVRPLGFRKEKLSLKHFKRPLEQSHHSDVSGIVGSEELASPTPRKKAKISGDVRSSGHPGVSISLQEAPSPQRNLGQLGSPSRRKISASASSLQGHSRE